MSESELRVYECETGGHAQHDDDGIWGLKESKYGKVVEELMRKNDENEKNDENDKDDENDENDDTYTWIIGDVQPGRGWTDES